MGVGTNIIGVLNNILYVSLVRLLKKFAMAVGMSLSLLSTASTSIWRAWRSLQEEFFGAFLKLMEFHFIPRTFRLNVFFSTSPKTGEDAISGVDPLRNPRVVGWIASDWEGLRNWTLGWLMFALPNSAISSFAMKSHVGGVDERCR